MIVLKIFEGKNLHRDVNMPKYASRKLPRKLSFSLIFLTLKHERTSLFYHALEKKKILIAEYLIPG